MKVGIFSPYLDILGGGERYTLTVVEFFLKRGDDVTIFWNSEFDRAKIKARFSLDMSKVKIAPAKNLATWKYDLIFWVSDGSIPLSFAKKNILHFQMPFKGNFRTLTNKIKLLKMTNIVCNSEFTKKYIDKSFGVTSQVIYPPVDIEKFRPGKKENIIVSVGRFFSPSHPKNQEILVETFNKLKLKDWQLVLIGGLADGQDITKLEDLAKNANIKIIANADHKMLESYLSRAKIYYHAAGFGFDLEHAPEKAEHFGITTVEAMSAGAVPVVFAGGGQLEIITANKNGLFWTTPQELAEKTLEVIGDSNLANDLSINAIKRSKDFSKQKFFNKLAKLL